MPRGVEVNPTVVERILNYSDDGHPRRQIAERLGMTYGQVNYITCNYGRTPGGEILRRPNVPASRTHPLKSAIEVHGSCTVEEGLNGGYIATVGDVWTGVETKTIHGAIVSAMVEAMQ